MTAAAAEFVDRLAYRPGDAIWGLRVSDTLSDVAARVRRTHQPLDALRRERAETTLAQLVAMLEQHAAASR